MSGLVMPSVENQNDPVNACKFTGIGRDPQFNKLLGYG